MKLTTKLTIKLLLIISLFCSNAFAEGDMGEGGLSGDVNENGKDCIECVIEGDENEDDSILDIIQEYLKDLLG